MSGGAGAIGITDFRGEWKEVGYRCEGDKKFIRHPGSYPEKYFTVDDGIYFHRDRLIRPEPFFPGCSSVQSAGTFQYQVRGDRIDLNEIDCKLSYSCPS